MAYLFHLVFLVGDSSGGLNVLSTVFTVNRLLTGGSSSGGLYVLSIGGGNVLSSLSDFVFLRLLTGGGGSFANSFLFSSSFVIPSMVIFLFSSTFNLASAFAADFAAAASAFASAFAFAAAITLAFASTLAFAFASFTAAFASKSLALSAAFSSFVFILCVALGFDLDLSLGFSTFLSSIAITFSGIGGGADPMPFPGVANLTAGGLAFHFSKLDGSFSSDGTAAFSACFIFLFSALLMRGALLMVGITGIFETKLMFSQ